MLGAGSAADVPADRTFHDLGLDSASGVRLLARLAATTGLDLPVGTIFDFPTPAALAQHVATASCGAAAAPPEPDPPGASAEPIAIVGMMTMKRPSSIATPSMMSW